MLISHRFCFRLWLTLSCLLPLLGPGYAQDWAKERLSASPRHLEWVAVPQGQRSIETFVAYPESAGKTTVVVVIHEIFGLTDWVRLQCDDLARAGYIAVAPNLLSGMGVEATQDVEAARKAISLLPPDQVTADLRAVTNYAAALPAGNGKVAVAGFCWGGTQSFRFATNSEQMVASFPFYGTAPEGKEALATIHGPVFGFYAENDARVNATLPATREAMESLGKRFETAVYEGAGHGFMRAGVAPDASPENARAHREAWERWLELLKGL
jgi:carboxymethylenebutenolidase